MSENLEEELFELMREYERPVETKGYSNKVIAGLTGLALGVLAFGIWVGSHFISPEPTQVPTPAPTLEARVIESPTLSPSPTVYFTPTLTIPEATPIYTEESQPTLIPTEPMPTPTTPPPTPTATTPPPSPTPIPNTPSGNVLGVGETWYYDGVRLKLESVDYDTFYDKVIPTFIFYNYTGHDILVSYRVGDNIRYFDNLGNEHSKPGLGCSDQHTDLIKNGESKILGYEYKKYRACFDADLWNRDIQHYIAVISDLGSIQEAKWKIPVHH